MSVTECASDDDFRSQLIASNNDEKSHVYVFLFSTSCEDCSKISPHFQAEADRYSTFGRTYLKIDVKKCTNTATTYGAWRGVPKIMVLKKGDIKDQLDKHLLLQSISNSEIGLDQSNRTNQQIGEPDDTTFRLLLHRTMTVIDCIDDDDFERRLAAVGTNKMAHVFFSSRSCKESATITPVFEHASKRYVQWEMAFLRLHVEECTRTVAKYNVMKTPIFLSFIKGEKFDEVEAADFDRDLGKKLRFIEKAAAKLGVVDLLEHINMEKIHVNMDNGSADSRVRNILLNSHATMKLTNTYFEHDGTWATCHYININFIEPVVLHQIHLKGDSVRAVKIYQQYFYNDGPIEFPATTETETVDGAQYHRVKLIRPTSVGWLQLWIQGNNVPHKEIGDLKIYGTPLGLDWRKNQVDRPEELVKSSEEFLKNPQKLNKNAEDIEGAEQQVKNAEEEKDEALHLLNNLQIEPPKEQASNRLNNLPDGHLSDKE